MMDPQIEEGLTLNLDFEKLPRAVRSCPKLVPVCVQSTETKEVLILAYVTPEALKLSLERQIAIFYSTSRQEIWEKGATSGDQLRLDEVRVNCEQNSLVFLVTPMGKGACHTQTEKGETRRTCFYRRIDSTTTLTFLESA